MPKKERTVAQALCDIASQYGKDVFTEQRRVYALLTDMAPGDIRAKERRRVKMALESGAVDILLKCAEDSSNTRLHFNEAVARLISQTDMAENIAKDTITMIADALAIGPSNSENNTAQSDNAAKQNSDEKRNSSAGKKTLARYLSDMPTAKIIASCALGIFGVSAVLALIYLFIILGQTGRQWFIGIGGGLVLSAGIIGLAFLIENRIYNEKCQTFTVALPILFAANIVLRAMLGDSTYSIIFRIISVWLVAGAIATTVLTRLEYEEKWTWPNIALAVCSAFLLFLWPGSFPWSAWQWIIGIGGGLVLCGLTAFLTMVLEEFGPEPHQTLSVILLLFTIANLILLFAVGQNYLIISLCFMAMLAIGAIITAFMSFTEFSPVFGFINIILAIINGGVFLILILGSYEQLTSFIRPLFGKIKR